MTLPKIVACLGASNTRGRFAYDWVGQMATQWGPRGFAFRNFGRDGDLAHDLVQRLDPVVAVGPDFVTILIGTNDVNATMSERNRGRYVRGNRLPQSPTQEWFRDCLTRVVATLQERTAARIAVMSLPVLGEDLGHEANRKVAAYSEAIRDVAAVAGVGYLPLFERQRDYLLSHPAPPGLAYSDGFAAIAKAFLSRYALRRSWDDISRRNSLRLTTEGVHLNRVGGGMVADLVGEFLAESAAPVGLPTNPAAL